MSRREVGDETAAAARLASPPQAAPKNDTKPVHPFHQPRLTGDQRRQLDADPAKAVAADPKNLDLLVAWAAMDPQAALAWINSGNEISWIEDGEKVTQSRENLLGAIAAGILIKDGLEAMKRFLAEHQHDPEVSVKNQGNLLKYAFINLGRDDTIDSALPLLREADDGSLAGMMVLGIDGAANQSRAIDYLEAKGFKTEVGYWAFQEAIDKDPRYWADWAQQRDSGLIADIVQAWARDQPDQANAWLNQRIPTTNPRRAEIDELLKP